MKLWNWIRRDGLLHIESCALIAVVVGLVTPWWVALPIAIAVGLGKELWDSEHNGVANWHDVICDIIGAVLGSLIAIF